jgi:hypothetical protein
VEYQERRAIVNEQRHRRVRLLVRKLNKERKKQAQKIDILCNDLIAAQRSFIKRLSTISFIANFCESIVGSADLNNLLYTAVRIIKAETADASVIFFLKNSDGSSSALRAGASSVPASTDFELHAFESSPPITFDKGHSFDCAELVAKPLVEGDRLEACFSPELMDGICKSNKVCTLEDMFAMGLQGNLVGLNKISAVTIPLGLSGSSLGFILLYRSSRSKLSADEIERVSAITYGLSRAIASCQSPIENGSTGSPSPGREG